MNKILGHIQNLKKRGLAVLIDPDKASETHLDELILLSLEAKADFFFVGGSLISSDSLEMVVQKLKEVKSIPTVLFPGNAQYISYDADAILLLSLISGRNPEYLIGQHVNAAMNLKRSGLEILPTGYMLIDGGKPTTASYISNTTPIPRDKPDIAVATAVAGELMGNQLIYLDAGSGAESSVPANLIRQVKSQIDIPLIVGGGINTASKAEMAYEAGADLIVIGNAIEKSPQFISEVAKIASEPAFQ
ncbi:geranylgeranylglyceryl/heptaprenylglyceryl phosphate synthase [Jiulongibacter sp. NS-SX5]|uniref:geranylgeranylglyceryl/heptaprenylglyceryl phosphate synthase n=1 Tax=Jiulongibacter sp. NS-SX5 TaxID=3463854 RepID=UPI004059F6C9